MTDNATRFMTALDSRIADILDACTRCGKCVEVCPMPEAAGIDATDPKAIAAGVLDIIRDGHGPEDSARWANACTGSGRCIQACEHGINPRFMTAVARAALRRHDDPDLSGLQLDSGKNFRGLTRGVRVLSQLQLPPDILQRLGQIRGGDEVENADIILYTGCNVLKTPHIILLCLDIMDALGASYRVMGGPSHCCGVLQFAAGDLEGFGRVSAKVIDRFAETGAPRVLSWCPSCQVHLGEAAMQTFAGDEAAPFDMTPFLIYLAGRLDELRPMMTRRVEKRVGLHEHPGVPGITEAARAMLEAIPGLEFVDLEQPRIGYMCNTINVLPDFKRDYHAEQLAAAAEAGVDTLAGIYHVCHRELCSHERDWPFEIVNFMELVGESMGFEHPDLFKRLKIMQDVDAIVRDSADMIEGYDMDLEDVRAIVLQNLLGEQPLPLARETASL